MVGVWETGVCTVARAQEYRGTVLGRVVDEQGAIMPGAPIVVTNEGTNVSAETVTEGDGAYVVNMTLKSGTNRFRAQG